MNTNTQFTIKVANAGMRVSNPLKKLDGNTYGSHKEACEAIYEAMYDVINGDHGCEMVDKSAYGTKNMYDDDGNFCDEMLEEYDSDCHNYICEYGSATEDGVTASVYEVDIED